MAYSHARLRKSLALMRILTGLVFLSMGSFKVSSMEFGKNLFPQFLDNGIQGAAVSWMRPVLEWILNFGPARVGVTLGFVELFIGVAMLLGLAVRPAALIGILYSTAVFFAAYNPSPDLPSMLRGAEHQFRNLFPVFIFMLLGVGHAGETWGLGALYHHHRARKWAREKEQEAPPADETEQRAPRNFQEYVAEEDGTWGAPETEMEPAHSGDEG